MKKIYIFALVLAIVTGVAVYSFGRSIEAKATPEAIPMTAVVMTVTEIKEGAFITADMVALKSIPTAYVVSGVATSLEDVVGKVNIYRAMANQQVVFSQLGSDESASILAGGRLSYTLAEGMRAMTIYVSEITGVAGYVAPGDRVDIVFSYHFMLPGAEAEGEEPEEIAVESTMMMLENIRVLEAGVITQKLTEAEGAEKAVYTSLTFELSPEDALKLQYAVTYGEISLVLRALNDEELAAPPMVTNLHMIEELSKRMQEVE